MRDLTPIEGEGLLIAVFYEGPWERLSGRLLRIDWRTNELRGEVKDGSWRERLSAIADARDKAWRRRYVVSGTRPAKRWKRRIANRQCKETT